MLWGNSFTLNITVFSHVIRNLCTSSFTMRNRTSTIRAAVYVITFCFLGLEALSQSTVSAGLMPTINIAYGIPKGYKIGHGFETRQRFYHKPVSGNGTFTHSSILTEYSTTLSKEISASKKISVGYILRVRGKDYYHRFEQDFTHTHIGALGKWSHRIRTDQMFSKHDDIMFRLRYRISYQKELSKSGNYPLFFKVNNEYNAMFHTHKHNDLEIRLVPTLRFPLTKSSILEMGIDSRISRMFEQDLSLIFWGYVGFSATL